MRRTGETTFVQLGGPRAGRLADQVVALGDVRDPTRGRRVRRGGGQVAVWGSLGQGMLTGRVPQRAADRCRPRPLTDDILDRIDEIVPPGTDIGTLDQTHIQLPSLRRRQAEHRAAV